MGIGNRIFGIVIGEGLDWYVCVYVGRDGTRDVLL